ncbi:MAG: type II toxin-antitoxin system VapC family toxin [Anaerolineae bacterium]
MNGERFFIDTVFVQALLNRRDYYHAQAKALLPSVRTAAEVWITEAILVEIGNALSAINRAGAANFIEQCYLTANIRVVSVDTTLLNRAILLYRNRPDKEWGLTDCISFIVMEEQSLTLALTADEHFRQAGYRALLLEMTETASKLANDLRYAR